MSAGKDEDIKKKILEVFEEVNRQRELAIKSGEEAKRQRDTATVQRNLAVTEKEKAEKRARENYANDLAYKSKTALKEGDLNTAFRLAEFAHRYVDADNPNVLPSLVDALYYNDNPDHTPLTRVANLEGHISLVYSVAFSPDGKRLATGHLDGTAKSGIWKVARLPSPSRGHTERIESVAFSPDGRRLATGSFEGTAKIWDLESGKAVLTLNRHTGSISGVNSVAFSPEGKRLATGSSDGTAKIWDLESGMAALTLVGHTKKVKSVAFSPDGKRLATGSDDGTAKIWD
ncbi:MAG: WD40 repeat domain-containing protein, partial [Lewinellaceae bacterium]|nr:WD40 repeat domain-containing protein [Lewinellaceae bacterium]